MDGVEEPLVEPTVIVNTAYADNDSDDQHRAGPNEPVSVDVIIEGSAKRWKCFSAMLGVVVCILLTAGGTTVYRQQMYTDPESAISEAAARTVIRLGNYSNRCTQPWEYACGRYAEHALSPSSVLDDAQAEVDVRLVAVVKGLPDTEPAKVFFDACMASGKVEHSRRDAPEWWWDRGLSAGGLTFGRARSNASRYRHLAVQISGDVGGDPQADCVMVPKTVCNGKLLEISTRVGSEATFDDKMCILGGSAEMACNLVDSARNSSFDRTFDFHGSAEFCLFETKRLWPTRTSIAWEDAHATGGADAEVKALFVSARSAIVSRLKAQHQHGLSKALASVQLHQRYVGPPEVYQAKLKHYESVFDWWEELLMEKEEFDRARLYVSKSEWDMASHTINAYYWPYANSVFITQAISRWMLDGASRAERIGRLGFLLGHELGHAIHSNINLLDDPAVRAAYHAGEMCLTEEYGGKTSLTTHEDMADRVGYGVVGSLSQFLPERLKTYCSRDGCNVINDKHVAFLAAAQPFCATNSIANTPINFDTHSPSAVRVRHSLQNTAAAAVAWDCKMPASSALCPVVGAPTQY